MEKVIGVCVCCGYSEVGRHLMQGIGSIDRGPHLGGEREGC